MVSRVLVTFALVLQIWNSMAAIAGNSQWNKIDEKDDSVHNTPPPLVKHKTVPTDKLQLIKPVGGSIAKNFVPLTEIPPPSLPSVHFHNGRRHMDENCGKKQPPKQVYEGANVEIWGDYYEEKFAKTVATVIFPDHIDHKHFEVTSQVPYLTVGPIEAIGYHPSTLKSEHPSECEKIYQDHIAEQYSDETQDFSEESLEMARMPLFPPEGGNIPINSDQEANMYDDISV